MECIQAAALECKALRARLGRPGERLAPYAAPGARAWALVITSGLIYLVLLIWIDELDASVITGVEPRL
jgi:hypothetical protein